MKFQPMTIEDYEKVSEFWKKHYKVSERDDPEHIKIFLEKNEGLSTLALSDNGDVIGTVLASYDGRKAYIQKLVVATEKRGKGIGEELLLHTLDKLKSAGALDIRVNCNEENVKFYEKCGFTRKPVVSMQIRDY